MGTVEPFFTSKTRINRAFKFASLTAVASLSYLISLRGIIHASYYDYVFTELSKRARRVLKVLATLNRINTNGYLGTNCALTEFARECARLTEEAASRATIFRALKELEEHGLIKRTSYVPAFIDKNSEAANIEISNGKWRTKTFVIVALTAKAIAMWNGPKKNKIKITGLPSKNVGATTTKCEKKLHVSKCNTDSLNDSLVPRIDSQSLVSHQRINKNNIITMEVSNGDNQSPLLPAETHLCDTPGKLCGSSLSEKPTIRETVPKGKTQEILTGVSVQLPPEIHHTKPTTWAWNRLKFLCDLASALKKYPTRSANTIFLKAKQETRPNYDSQFGISTNWQYWILRWREFTLPQRKIFLRSQIIPSLNRQPVPSCKEISKPHTLPAKSQTETTKEYFANKAEKFKKKGSEYLAGFAERMSKKDWKINN